MWSRKMGRLTGGVGLVKPRSTAVTAVDLTTEAQGKMVPAEGMTAAFARLETWRADIRGWRKGA
jgi:hypothetical protein